MLSFHKTKIRVSIVVQQTSHDHLRELIASKLLYYSMFGLYQFKKPLELEPALFCHHEQTELIFWVSTPSEPH